MAEFKKQHYLPQFYLKGFALDDAFNSKNNIRIESNIWFYDRRTNKIDYKSIRNVAWEPYYYSFKNEKGEYNHNIEKSFSNIESEVAGVFNKINHNAEILTRKLKKTITPLNAEDIQILLVFLKVMMNRNPKIMHALREDYEPFYLDLTKQYNIKYDENEVKKKILEVMTTIGNSSEMNFLKKLSSKNIYLLHLKNDFSSFITTDSPVTTFRKTGPPGIKYNDTEIYFPLNRRVLLILYGEGVNIYYVENSNRKFLYKLNRYIASSFKNLIISRDEAYLRKIIKDFKKHGIIDMGKHKEN